jgi:hypothetical protein
MWLAVLISNPHKLNKDTFIIHLKYGLGLINLGSRRGRDRMVVGFTCAIKCLTPQTLRA